MASIELIKMQLYSDSEQPNSAQGAWQSKNNKINTSKTWLKHKIIQAMQMQN